MDDQQQFCLRWNDFQTNMVASFKHLRDEKSFCDVTLACDGQSCKAHKMILSACSPYFKVTEKKRERGERGVRRREGVIGGRKGKKEGRRESASERERERERERARVKRTYANLESRM